MTALVIFTANVAVLAWLVSRLVSLAVTTWRESDEVAVPFVLEQPARDYYEAGHLSVFLVRSQVELHTMPQP